MKRIEDSTNIYTPDDRLGVPLIRHMIDGETDLVDYIWNIYESDFEFIQNMIKQKFVWPKSILLIGFGDSDSATLTQLHQEYINCENTRDVDYKKCAVFLVKSDNVTPINVFCVSPKTSAGRLVTVRMIKHVLPNGFLNINTKWSNDISLLNCTAIAGNLKIFTKLLNYGIKPNLQEVLGFALENGRLEFLLELYTKHPVKMYSDILETFYMFKKLIRTDNWELFKYVVDNAVVEKGTTWSRILNHRWSSKRNKYSDNTVFRYLLSCHCIKIATKCLTYEHNIDIKNNFKLWNHPILDLAITKESKGLALRMISIEPMLIFRILHNLIEVLTVDEVIELFEKYSWVKHAYSKNLFYATHHIDNLLQNDQFEKMKLLLENSKNQMDDEIVYKMLKSIMWTCNDNIEMFKYVLLLRPSFDLTSLPIDKKERLILSSISFRNSRICRFLVLKLNFDLNNLSTDVLLIPNRSRHSNNIAKINRIYRTLLQLGKHFNTLDYLNLLISAIRANNFYGTKVMLELGANISIREIFTKNLPIHYARSLEIFELLNTWTTKSYVNAKGFKLDTPLHKCMKYEPSEATHNLIKYILENGGNINATNSDGISPIFIKSNRETVALLLKYNPDLYLTCSFHNKPLLFLALNEHNECIAEIIFNDKNSKFRLYLDHLCSGIYYRDFILRTFQSNSITSQLLIELPNLNVFVCDSHGNSCLHLAVAAGNFHVLDKLIEKGLSIEERNYAKDTVLLVYCKNTYAHVISGSNDLIQQLFKHNPDVNVRNKKGMTPILYAAQFDQKGEFILELLARGANLSDRDKNGKTAYDHLSDELKMCLKCMRPGTRLKKFLKF